MQSRPETRFQDLVFIQRGIRGSIYITRRQRVHRYANPTYESVERLINLIECYHFRIALNPDGWTASALNAQLLTRNSPESPHGQE